jgi:receptor expression-enhancing protein 1/2/3/4
VLHPFLAVHEHDIENFIARSHEQAMAAGLEYFQRIAAWVRAQLGMPAVEAAPSARAGTGSNYAQNLLSRFSLPAVGNLTSASATAGAADIYSFLSSAIGKGTETRSREAQAEDLAASGTLIPPEIASATQEERLGFIASQREKLQVLMSALDREATNVGLASVNVTAVRERTTSAVPTAASRSASASQLPKNLSEDNFERVDKEEALSGVEDSASSPKPQTPGPAGSWMPWNWKGGPSQPGTPREEQKEQIFAAVPRGKTSGVDL